MILQSDLQEKQSADPEALDDIGMQEYSRNGMII